MFFDLINPLMLLGLAGIALPVLAHLLSKKTYDVVDWGAMQFLELGKDARRRVRLEDLLLLLLRMFLVALLAFALARPWASGGFLSEMIAKQNRDIVLVIDGSYSMGREGAAMIPHAAAVQWAHEFLEELQPGDTVALLDARENVRPVIDSPIRDLSFVRHELDQLPAPAGGSDLAAAASYACQLLCRTSNVARDVIILTDGQARGWRTSDESYWKRFDDLRQQAAVSPRTWVVNVLAQKTANRPNFTVGRLRLSRELTVTGFPITVQTKIGYSSGADPKQTARPIERNVYFEVDGQRLAEKTVSVRLLPGGEASVEFEYRFPATGSQLIRVSIDDDSLPGDNQSEAAVSVADAMPVLLVNGQPDSDPTRAETFFARAALSAPTNRAPWVSATVIDHTDLESRHLDTVEVVLLSNISTLTEAQATALSAFASRGGGLCLSVGDKVDADVWNERLFNSGAGLLPVAIGAVTSDVDPDSSGVRVADDSLVFPWTTRFRSDKGGTLTHARFDHWMTVTTPTEDATNEPDSEDRVQQRSARVIARFENGDPFLVARRFERGDVFLITSSLDADWNTLPAKPDYVAFLHEIVFQLATGTISWNVDVGVPIVVPVANDAGTEDYVFIGPGDTRFPALPAGDELRPQVRLDDTRLPGVYRLEHEAAEVGSKDSQFFVVNSDRGESDLTILSDNERLAFKQNERLSFISTKDELQTEMSVGGSKTEFWHLLLLVFLTLLIGEVALTRRLVRGGHVVDSESP
jgi:hypothetical protein